jgi:hypothetical protein
LISYTLVSEENKGGGILMQKLIAMATTAFILTGFAGTAYAGTGEYYIRHKLFQDKEKRQEQTQKNANPDNCQDKKAVECK